MNKQSVEGLSRGTVNQRIADGLARRRRSETIFRGLGFISLVTGFLMVLFILFDITIKAIPAFHQHWLALEVTYDKTILGVNQETTDLTRLNYRGLLQQSMQAKFPAVSESHDIRQLNGLVSSYADLTLKNHLLEHPGAFNETVVIEILLDDDVDIYLKQAAQIGQPEFRINTMEAQWLEELWNRGLIVNKFNYEFFANSDSREPELAGIRGALAGTLLTMMVTLILSFPIGVGAALYLEEFAPKNKWTDLIEININNLAAVPSIIFGLLGMAIIINLFTLPRSAPIVAGIVLTLMTLPTIIIASRSAINAVPISIREAAYGLGASKVQTAFGHVLPMAMPGILSGTIIGMSQALGETAPLLLIGMVAFIVDIPTSVTDSATVMPVQIFMWADSPEQSFVAKTSAAIMVLLGFLFILNATAAYLRRKFETK